MAFTLELTVWNEMEGQLPPVTLSRMKIETADLSLARAPRLVNEVTSLNNFYLRELG